jgi:hypothetical protein
MASLVLVAFVALGLAVFGVTLVGMLRRPED